MRNKENEIILKLMACEFEDFRVILTFCSFIFWIQSVKGPRSLANMFCVPFFRGGGVSRLWITGFGPKIRSDYGFNAPAQFPRTRGSCECSGLQI